MVDRSPLVDLVGMVSDWTMLVPMKIRRLRCSTSSQLCSNSTKSRRSMVPLFLSNGSSRVLLTQSWFTPSCQLLIQMIRDPWPKISIWLMVIASGLSHMSLIIEVWLWLWTSCYRSRISRSWRPMVTGPLESCTLTQQQYVGICRVKPELQETNVEPSCIQCPLSFLGRRLLGHHLQSRIA